MSGVPTWFEPWVPTRARSYLRRSRRFRAALIVLGVWITVALVSGFVPSNPTALSETLHASRSTLLIVIEVLLLAVPLGWMLGLVAGAGPRVADTVLTRLVELGGVWPTIVLLAVVRAAEPEPTVAGFVLVVGVTRALRTARLVRGEALRARAAPHVVAARAIGLSQRRWLTTHVAPLTMGPLLVSASFTAAAVVGLESALSFVGLGAPESFATWGTQLGATSGWGRVAPAACAAAATIALVLLADSLDDALEPHRSLSEPPY